MSLPESIDPGTLKSRRALIIVIQGLYDHKDALTVLGGHAVMEVTRHISALPPPDTTTDGDLGVKPQLLADSPLLFERMAQLGFGPKNPSRPGIWAPIDKNGQPAHDQASVDLIAPMSVARGTTTRKAIRAARVGAHGSRAVAATEGTELSLIDRSLMTLRSFDDTPSIEAYVAGPTALLCTKAYKLHDRLEPSEFVRRRDRLRPKDFADIYRLLHAVTPGAAHTIFERGARDSDISEAVVLGKTYLTEILQDDAQLANYVAESWAAPSFEGALRQYIRTWRREFTDLG